MLCRRRRSQRGGGRRRGGGGRRGRGRYRHLLSDLLDLYGNFCFYCGKSIQGTPDIDHVKPLSKGGSNKLKNLRISCPSCNRSKGAKSLNEFLKYSDQAGLFITTAAKWLNRNQKFIRAGAIIATASPFIEIAIYVAPPTYDHILKPFGKGFMKGYRLAVRDKTYPEFYQAAAMLAGCPYHILDVKSPKGSNSDDTDHLPDEVPVIPDTGAGTRGEGDKKSEAEPATPYYGAATSGSNYNFWTKLLIRIRNFWSRLLRRNRTGLQRQSMKGHASHDITHPEFYSAAAILAGCQYHVLDSISPKGFSPNDADHRPDETQQSPTVGTRGGDYDH